MTIPVRVHDAADQEQALRRVQPAVRSADPGFRARPGGALTRREVVPSPASSVKPWQPAGAGRGSA